MADHPELHHRLLEWSRFLDLEPHAADAPMRVRDRPSSEKDSGDGDNGEEACALEALVSRPRVRTSSCGCPDHASTLCAHTIGTIAVDSS
ncbi:hypothetical protein MRX96_055817 [Rhipicephalus microplus]